MSGPNLVVALNTAVLRYCPELSNFPCFVGGGFLRDTFCDEPPRDLDVYFYNESDHEATGVNLIRHGWSMDEALSRVATFTKAGKTVQLCCFGETCPRDFVDRADFTMCAVALDLQTLELCEHESFRKDLTDSALVLHRPRIPVRTLKRVGEFLNRGYTISGDELLKLHALVLATAGTDNGVFEDKDVTACAFQDYAGSKAA